MTVRCLKESKHIVESANDTIDHYTVEGTKQGDPNKYLNVAHESLIGSRHEHFFLRFSFSSLREAAGRQAGWLAGWLAGSRGLIWKTGSPRS
ncbi:hypothetical protein M0804_006199 [Polistes exclamans]|nr:hypothetical protein M0804_006199 [Polistes exclamans]